MEARWQASSLYRLRVLLRARSRAARLVILRYAPQASQRRDDPLPNGPSAAEQGLIYREPHDQTNEFEDSKRPL
jgi:hypothetical protein